MLGVIPYAGLSFFTYETLKSLHRGEERGAHTCVWMDGEVEVDGGEWREGQAGGPGSGSGGDRANKPTDTCYLV